MRQVQTECGLLATIVTLISVTVGRRNSSPFFFLEASCLVVLTLVSVAIELGGRSKIMDVFSPRLGSTAGVPLGVITLPILFISRIAQDERLGNAQARSWGQYNLWVTFACGAGMLGTILLLSHRFPQDTGVGQLAECSSEAGDRGPQTDRTIMEPSKKTERLVRSRISKSGEGDRKKMMRRRRKVSPGTLLIAAAGWCRGSMLFVLLAFCFAGNEEPGIVFIWLTVHATSCGGLLFFLLHIFPGSTTPGEALLISQGVTLYGLDAVGRTVAVGMLVGMLLLVPLWLGAAKVGLWLLSVHRPGKRAEEARRGRDRWHQVAAFYSSLGLMAGYLVPLWLQRVVGLDKHPLTWAVVHILEHAPARLSLCAYWLLLLLLPLPLLRRWADETRFAPILLRKAYHLMAVAMFGPALLMQPGFLQLAFGVALAALLLVEIVRVGSIPPFGPSLHSFMTSFIDSRDSGVVILSHFSLLLGCALPVWMSDSDRGLPPFAGILSLGIGDTMASVIGSQYGRFRVASDSRKTVEGTVAGITSILTAVALLAPLTNHPPQSTAQWVVVGVATTGAGLLEAFTTQLDNAFVPIVYYALLCL